MALKLSFRDNSEHESGFHVYRSDAPMDPRNLPKPYKDLGRNSSVVIDEDFGGIFDQRRYYRVAAYVKGGNRSVSEEAHAGYDGKSPTLNLDFASLQYAVAQGIGLDLSPRAFSDLITFTRSTGGGRFNANGQYEWLPANTPRIDYDPVTGECRGLLVEEQRTNLLRYSSDFANATWVKNSATVSGDVTTGPGGTVGADKIVESAAAAQHFIQQITGVASGSTYTYSVWVKSAGRTFCAVLMAQASTPFPVHARAIVNLTTGVVTSGAATTKYFGDGWWRISVSGITSSTSEICRIAPVFEGSDYYTGDGSSGIYIWGAQLEAGSFPTSLIHTTDAQVTRAADVASVNELSPWYNPEAGTLFVEWVHISELVPAGTSQYVVGLFAGNAVTNFVNIQRNDNEIIQGLSSVGGVDQGAINAKLGADTRSHRAAMSVSAAGRYISVDGSSALTGPQTAMPVFDRMFIGNRWDAVRAINGHIRMVKYLPKRVSNSELQAMTQV